MKKYMTVVSISFLFILLFTLLFSPKTQALLSLELKQGVKSTLPIAIVGFSDTDELAITDQPDKVIMKDLLTSGEFNIATGTRLPAQPHGVSAVKLAEWRKLGVQDLVLGSVKKISADRYRVAINLIAVYGADTTDGGVAPSSVLFSRSYTVSKHQLRALGHQLSNKIYEILTGIPGIFTTHIAYVLVTPSLSAAHHEFQLIVADYDGYHPQTLVTSNQPIMSPAWSHDRTKLAFVSFKNKLPALYSVDIASGNLTALTQPGSVNGAPAWSPDDTQIVFASAPTGVPKLFLLDLSTHRIKQLTQGPAIDTEPSYAPDGQSLVFTSSRGGAAQIYRYYFNNQSIERLTYDGDYNAKASICGNHLAILHGQDHQYNIAVQNLATDKLTVLTDNGIDESPSWSPNCQLILYATELNHKPALALVSVDGSIKIDFPASQGDVQKPAWQ